jgi:hypothetical protein
MISCISFVTIGLNPHKDVYTWASRAANESNWTYHKQSPEGGYERNVTPHGHQERLAEPRLRHPKAAPSKQGTAKRNRDEGKELFESRKTARVAEPLPNSRTSSENECDPGEVEEKLEELRSIVQGSVAWGDEPEEDEYQMLSTVLMPHPGKELEI